MSEKPESVYSKQQLDEMRSQNSQLKEKIRRLENEIAAKDARNEEKVEGMQREIRRLENETAAKDARNEEKVEGMQREIRRLENEIAAKDARNEEKVEGMQREIRRLENETAARDARNEEKVEGMQREIRRLENEIAAKDARNEEKAEGMQREIRRLENEIENLQTQVAQINQDLEEKKRRLQELDIFVLDMPDLPEKELPQEEMDVSNELQFPTDVTLENPLVSLEWNDYTKLPIGMQHAQAVVVGDKVYVGGGMTTDPEMETNIFVFDHTIESPKVIPIPTPGPTRWSMLATIHSQLVLAGGASARTNATDEVWALQDDGCTWDQPFPPMPQACWGAATLSSEDYLILAGGVENHPSEPLNTVQVYNINSRQWALAESLPMSCYFVKGVLHNGDWYLAGGRWQYQEIFHASIESLIATSEGRKDNISGWKSFPYLSRCCSSLSVYQNQLVAIGGARSIYMDPTREIRVYSTEKQSWIEAEILPKPMDSTSIILLPATKNGKEDMLLIGGNIGDYNSSFSNSVIKANLKVAHSLKDNFSRSALAHIQMVTRFPIFDCLVCGEMNDAAADLLQDVTTGQTSVASSRALFKEWLTGYSANTKPPTWEVLLQLLRDMRMDYMAEKVEHLFTDKEAYGGKQRPASVGDQLQPVMVNQPRGIGYLRGVDVIGETSLMVTNEAQSFYWRGYGLKLHIPKGALPENESMCTIDIKMCISGEFQLHPSHTLASAVYWLYSTVKRFSKFFTLEVQHHPIHSQSSRLCFVVADCSQKELPYTFEPLQGGVFLESSYGSMKLDHFSGYAIVQEGADSLRYCGRLFYRGGRTNRRVDFVIAQNLEAHRTSVTREYATRFAAIEGPDLLIEFQTDRVTMDIPKSGVDGWIITPLITPMILKKEVEGFQQGRRIPSCQLSVQWQGEAPATDLPFCYRVKLQGAKEPFDYLVIESDPVAEQVVPAKESMKRTKPVPTPKELMTALHHEVADKWKAIGTHLEISQGTLDTIAEKELYNPYACLMEMLNVWLQRAEPTWSAIIEAVRFLGKEQLALKLTQKYC